MPSLNTTARNTAADAVAATYTAGTLVIYAGATALATHTIAGFGAASAGVVTANAIADVTIAAPGGTATSAKMIAGANEVTLTVGTSGAEVNMSSLTLVEGGTSTINSLTITMPAS